MIDASQAKAETWLNDEYELNPKIRDVREHGAQAHRSCSGAPCRCASHFGLLPRVRSF